MNVVWAGAVMAGIFVTMLFFVEVGWRVGRTQRGSDGLGALDGAIFGLMGLLVAFTFGGANARFDHRRDLIVEEANDVGTAYLRLDLLPTADRDWMRAKMRDYVDARLEIYQHVDDYQPSLAKANALQAEMWQRAINCKPAQPATMLLLPALNAMFDISSTRLAATQMHPPAIIYLLLMVVFLLCSMLGGYSMASRETRSWLHAIIFVATLTVTFYTVLDLEYPRRGLVQVTSFDQILVNVRDGMK